MSDNNPNMSGDDEDIGQYNDIGYKDNRPGGTSHQPPQILTKNKTIALGDNNIRLPIIDHIEKLDKLIDDIGEEVISIRQDITQCRIGNFPFRKFLIHFLVSDKFEK
jgi:hypothetical protein